MTFWWPTLAYYLAPQLSPTLSHSLMRTSYKLASSWAQLSVGAGWHSMVWADVRNAHASPTSKIKVKSLVGPVLTWGIFDVHNSRDYNIQVVSAWIWVVCHKIHHWWSVLRIFATHQHNQTSLTCLLRCQDPGVESLRRQSSGSSHHQSAAPLWHFNCGYTDGAFSAHRAWETQTWCDF